MLLSTEAFGGYLGLELAEHPAEWLDKAYKFNSARAAFAHFVTQLNIGKVWLPRYICNTMIDFLSSQGTEITFYDINDEFEITTEIGLDPHSLLLYVNYFGLCSRQAHKVIERYGAANVVIDNSQAFFNKPFESLATIYSPRKYFGVPDGGLLYINGGNIQLPEQRDASSETRMSHLISRLSNSPEAAYQQYLEAEKAISKLQIKRMSRLTERLLRSIDYERAKIIRLGNARHLNKYLREYNQLNFTINEDSVPLCYPFLPKVETSTREELIRKRVFLPCYWTEALCRVEEGGFEWALINRGLFLPCDQRYNETDMEKLISLLEIK